MITSLDIFHLNLVHLLLHAIKLLKLLGEFILLLLHWVVLLVLLRSGLLSVIAIVSRWHMLLSSSISWFLGVILGQRPICEYACHLWSSFLLLPCSQIILDEAWLIDLSITTTVGIFALQGLTLVGFLKVGEYTRVILSFGWATLYTCYYAGVIGLYPLLCCSLDILSIQRPIIHFLRHRLSLSIKHLSHISFSRAGSQFDTCYLIVILSLASGESWVFLLVWRVDTCAIGCLEIMRSKRWFLHWCIRVLLIRALTLWVILILGRSASDVLYICYGYIFSH